MNSEERKKNSSSTALSTQGGEGIADQAKQAVSHVADQAKEQVTHQMDLRKDKAAEKLGEVANAVRETGDKLKDVGPLGDVAERAAEGLQNVASFFERRQVTDIVRDVERFARREPAIFLGAAFALGLIGGRFLKSSSHRDEGSLREEDSDISGASDEGYLASEDLEDYESQPYDGSTWNEQEYRTPTYGSGPQQFSRTQPMPTRTPEPVGSEATGSIKPSPIVNAAGSSGAGVAGSTPSPTRTPITESREPKIGRP